MGLASLGAVPARADLPRSIAALKLVRCSCPLECGGAGEGNRTLVVSLEGFCSTIELHPPDEPSFLAQFPRKTARHLPLEGTESFLVEEVGFEPT
jgi:hypothetical protein